MDGDASDCEIDSDADTERCSRVKEGQENELDSSCDEADEMDEGVTIENLQDYVIRFDDNDELDCSLFIESILKSQFGDRIRTIPELAVEFRPEPSIQNTDQEPPFGHEVFSLTTSLVHNVDSNNEEYTEIQQLEESKADDLTMKRAPLPPELATRGNPSRLPFLPTCFIEAKVKSSKTNISQTGNTFMGKSLLCRVGDLNIGIDFEKDGFSILNNDYDALHKNYNNVDENEESDDENLTFELAEFESDKTIDDPLSDIWKDNDDVIDKFLTKSKENVENKEEENSLENAVVGSLANVPMINTSTYMPKLQKNETEWVEIMNTNAPVKDFEKLVPNMAHKYPFELDNFQKLAIMKLEEQGHVFVAAHTSAGKTVVAEYAIALSLKHCTRIVYTSPVKALSNQKYREFSTIFGDVGLITGDIQINTTASCLVMTTEILRSMLYYGADVIRDLEYVIFDEVHYINDTQRGYVWEEVLILLPAHCGIVMLSATVPNTLEFADWVGRTKKRKVYVVSTLQRPVALCHYLYTGCGGSTKDNRYLIVDQKGLFRKEGYEKACHSKSQIKEKAKRQKGSNKPPSLDKPMWIGLIDHLKRHDKLPVVAFVLSRKRCDITAENLQSQDLTTAKEKSRIHNFIKACLNKLSESDRKLPQVTTMQSLLSCGIGIHHSGILPILKEVVEMLFQLGLVKILFATETFALGVNMPARTVVFDSITKYDGLNWRSLMPSEYIQMAGRAGRRGLDDTGTVIILCKKEVPPSTDLIAMMLGKPSKLSSQFRVTYATMLSLLRVRNLSIESMMKCSFREFGVQNKTSTHKLEMQATYELLSRTPKSPNYDYLSRFCDTAVKHFKEITDIMPIILSQKSKEINTGKIVVVYYGKYAHHYGIILGFTGVKSRDLRIMVLEYDEGYYATPPDIKNKDLWYTIISYSGDSAAKQCFYRYPKHTVITVKYKHIVHVTKHKFKGECAKILNDFDTRQHLKTTSPSKLCLQAVQMLAEISFNSTNHDTKIEFIDLMKGLKVNKGEILSTINRCKELHEQVLSFGVPCKHPNFYEEFPIVFQRKQLEWKYDELERLLSSEEMTLFPEYQRRLEVLKELGYIDNEHHVAIKGRVACELGKNELMITEIVFRNILTDLEPAEIAALLSCLVVESRIELTVPQKLTPILEEKILEIQEVDMDLSELEKTYKVGADDPAAQADRLNFGLVQVTYEWSLGKSFCEVMLITEVQEGIIVHSIQKLHEILMNVKDVAKIIGDPILEAKMNEASLAIKRDIVFAASLYTQDDINMKSMTDV